MTVRVSTETYTALIQAQSRLEEKMGLKISLSETIGLLIRTFNVDNFLGVLNLESIKKEKKHGTKKT